MSNTSSSRVLSALIPASPPCLHASPASSISPRAGPRRAAAPTPAMPCLSASPGLCSGLSSLRSLPVVISDDVRWQWEEEGKPPSSAFPRLPIPKAVVLGQLTPASFLLWQKCKERLLWKDPDWLLPIASCRFLTWTVLLFSVPSGTVFPT